MDHAHLREQCATALLSAAPKVSQLRAFLGLDGFVDEIIHVVDKRDSATSYQRVGTIEQLGRRVAAAAGRSTNIELVNHRTKLGGNGPIMANALAQLGFRVTYVGALGYPNLHPVFQEFATRAEVVSIAEAGRTDALEFSDGKLMLTKTVQLNEVNWANIQERFGRERFQDRFNHSDLVAFVNWTMLTYMSDLWAALQEECRRQPPPSVRRLLFIDLADPEKRTKEDLLRALELVKGFESFFEVALGLNEKEACEVGEALGLPAQDHSPDGIRALTRSLHERLGISNLIVHPVTYAVAVSRGQLASMRGPHVPEPVLTTGAGDHFNSGWCLGKLLQFEPAACLLCGVAASGFYVQRGQTPGLEDLASILRAWPEQ